MKEEEPVAWPVWARRIGGAVLAAGVLGWLVAPIFMPDWRVKVFGVMAAFKGLVFAESILTLVACSLFAASGCGEHMFSRAARRIVGTIGLQTCLCLIVFSGVTWDWQTNIVRSFGR